MGRNCWKQLLRSLGVAQGVAVLTLVAFSSLSAQTVSFLARRDFAAGRSPQSVAVGDFNGDGVEDLAVAILNPASVSVLLGNGDGTFQAAVNFGAGFAPQSVAVGDFNGDGVQDLAVANARSHNVSVLLGNGDGTFQAGGDFGAGLSPASVAVGDFNSDARRDLAVANFSSDVSVLINNTPTPSRPTDVLGSPLRPTRANK